MKSLLFGEGFFIVDENLRGSGFSLRTCFQRSIEIAKDEQVSRYSTPVQPPFAEALVRANLPEMCLKKDIAA